jgi:hypothetical protein
LIIQITFTIVKKISLFLVIALFGLGLAVSSFGGSATAYAQSEDVATSTPAHKTGSTHPLYFFNALGIHTTIGAAEAVWRDSAVRQLILELWRVKTFGSDYDK